jgi:hypothetical protein
MKKNMGITDRLVRGVLIAPTLVIVAFLVGFTTLVGVIAVALVAVMLATAAVGFCPLYVPFHLHTGRRRVSAS